MRPAVGTWHLYDNPASGNCWKVRQILALRGIEYSTEVVEVGGDTRTTRRNTPVDATPGGRIPVVVGPDGTRLGESCAILMWFADGTPWLPDNRLQRQRTIEWLFFEQSTHEPALAVLRYIRHVAPEIAEREQRWAEILETRARAALARMDKHLADTAWFSGDPAPDAADGQTGFGIADIALYPYTRMADHAGIAVASGGEWPRIAAWLDRVESQDGHVPLPCL